jgi:hypothetical protein
MSNSPDASELTADRIAINDILSQHSRALDRNNSAWLKDCYWPEATVDYGNFKGPAHTFAELVGPALAEAYELTRHAISNTLVQFQGAQARTESYVLASHLFQGGEQEMRFEGRYLDQLEKRDGQWRMLHRQVVMDWSHTSKLADERNTEAFAALAKGSNDGDDPLHPFLSTGA